ncbi:MAG: bifunctional precorrin-2 dehydrogenase/sirohydrochlorin ferrochelatase [Candidatus Bathyarchaeota archaeon]|nr:bifunctional precorrin-2 dehydrogenase/sirohydrochlorin ferrochelatase [Candidatus Bathyarchaeota archaeon]
MLIDLKLGGKTVIVVGGGSEAYRKIQSFLDSGATIWVISKKFSSGIQKLNEEKKVILLKTEIKDCTSFVDCLNPKPDVLLAVTNDSKLNSKLVQAAKAWGCMVYSVDNPVLSDFILPAVARIGDVKVAVSTGGKSPAMAHVLRERIEKMVTPEDLLAIELQANMRSILKEKVSDSKTRSKLLYEILNNNNIKEALSKSKLKEAQELAMKLIEKREK